METELGSIVKDSKDTCLVLEQQLQNLYQLLGSCDYDLEAKVHRLLDEVRAEYQLSISLRDQDSVQVYHQSSSDNSDSESDQSCDVNLSGSCDSEFSEFANFQQQYENENLSQQELEDLWEQFNSHRIVESEEQESEFSEFANFQQQYENENLSQRELEDLWEQFNSQSIHESEENFSSSEQQEEQENELENYSSADENESLDPGGSQSPFSEASDNSADN
jgi:hypothetical protein